MPKTVPESKFTELAGLDRISQIVHKMKCLFREINKSDFGIDGEIEICVPKEDGKGYISTGGIIKVQAKAGSSHITGDTSTAFSAKSKKDDFEYWNNSNFPVLFIIFHPEDDKLYWKEMKTFLKTTPEVWHPPHKVIFDKSEDVFDLECLEKLHNIAKVSPPRVSKGEKEKLYSNLLEIRKMPPLVWSAPCNDYQHEDILNNIEGYIPPFKVYNKRLHTLADLSNPECVLREYCDLSDILREPANEFWSEEDNRRVYIYLVNQLLNKQLMRQGLKYNHEYNRSYFPREKESSTEFKKEWFNIRTGKTSNKLRTVAKYYEYGTDKFWRHMAARINIIMIGNKWFLRIIPMYFFTEDGNIPWDSEKVGSYTTRIKSRQTNQHVLNQLLFWSNAIAGLNSHGSMINIWLDKKPIMKIDKMPVSGIANFAIPYDPATYEEPEITEQISFLEFFDQFKDDEDDSFE